MNHKQKVEKCAKWLVYCLSIGWRKDQLDELERTWWKYYGKPKEDKGGEDDSEDGLHKRN